MEITVAIVEDDAGFRAGLLRIFATAKGFRCVGAYSDAETALRKIPDDKPDVVLMDINLPGMSGVECVRELSAQPAAPKVVMLTVHDNPDYIFEALAAGATGYLLKGMSPAQTLTAIREVYDGGAAMNSQIARKVVEFFRPKAGAGGDKDLSSREKEILQRLAQGYLLKEIGDELGIGFTTVRTHVRRIYEKLHVHSRAQAVASYFQASV